MAIFFTGIVHDFICVNTNLILLGNLDVNEGLKNCWLKRFNDHFQCCGAFVS